MTETRIHAEQVRLLAQYERERATDAASIRSLTDDNARLREELDRLNAGRGELAAELSAIRPAYVSSNGETLRMHHGCGGTAPLRDDELAEIECPRCGRVDADGWTVLLIGGAS